jgi:hypothetical protein
MLGLTTMSVSLMVMPLTEDIAMGLTGFTANTDIAHAITAIVRAITATDTVHAITATDGEAMAGPAMAGEDTVGKDVAGRDRVGEARAYKDTAGEGKEGEAGEDEVRVEAEVMRQSPLPFVYLGK